MNEQPVLIPISREFVVLLKLSQNFHIWTKQYILPTVSVYVRAPWAQEMEIYKRKYSAVQDVAMRNQVYKFEYRRL